MPHHALRLLSVLLPLLLSLLVCGLIVALSGGDPAAALSALFTGAFGSPEGIASTLTKATPLMLVGLAVAVALRAGLFNIGGEGQLYAGGIAAAAAGASLSGMPAVLHLPVTLFAGACAGGLWGALPGWLKARRGVHEVISTIALNAVAVQLTDYLVNGPMAAGSAVSQTQPVAESAWLPVLWSVPPASVGAGLLVALALCWACDAVLFRTPFGYEVRAVGLGPEASRSGGIDVPKVLVRAMALGGALAGLAGAVEVCGVHRTFYAQFSPGYGFDGVAVALLARNHPLGVIPAALLFGGMRTADRYLQLSAGVSRDLVVILQGAVIFFVGAERVGKSVIEKIMRGRQPSPTP